MHDPAASKNPAHMNQSTSSVFMVRPHSFRKNEETATNNHYQRDIAQASPEESSNRQRRVRRFGGQLRAAGIEVVVFDEAEPHETPDALFPNNWISTHADGTSPCTPCSLPTGGPSVEKTFLWCSNINLASTCGKSSISPNSNPTTNSWRGREHCARPNQPKGVRRFE